MNKLKYIVFKGVLNLESIVFPSTMSHDHMARNLGIRDNSKILGAGFTKMINDGGVLKYECYGDSVSLKVNARPIEDSLKLTVDYLGRQHRI